MFSRRPFNKKSPAGRWGTPGGTREIGGAARTRTSRSLGLPSCLRPPLGPCGPGTGSSPTGRLGILPHLGPPRTCRWENKDIYAAAIRSLRLRELQNPECVTAVRAGLGAIIPLQLLTTLSPLEMELRTCGLPYINLEFLKVGGLGPGRVDSVGGDLSWYFLCPSTLSSRAAGGACSPHLTAELAGAYSWQHVAGSASYPDRWPLSPGLKPHPE